MTTTSGIDIPRVHAAPPAAAGKPTPRGGASRRRALLAWTLMLPLLAVNLLVVVGPAVMSVRYSFTDWSGVGPAHPVGLANYRRLVGDPEFHSALAHNLLWTAFFLVVPISMGLLGAFLLSRVGRWQLLFRVVYFIPYVVATVVNAAIWDNLLDPEAGFGAGLDRLGVGLLAGVNFLGDPSLALPAVAFVNNWQWWGFLVVVFLAAMQGVNHSLYEAARLDGANRWQEFRHVTLPAIQPTLLFLVLMTIIWSFLVFDYVFILTQGGPAGATDVLGTVLYRNAFANNEAGYAAAYGVVMGLISVAVVSGYLALRRRRGWTA